jgi:membrane protein YqaA with SNARE-associated domain
MRRRERQFVGMAVCVVVESTHSLLCWHLIPKTAITVMTIGPTIWHWILRLGAFGFIPLGLADASVVPLPGSMDVLLVVLASRQKALWPFYTAMATVGAVLGGYLTYQVALKGGEETFEKKTSPRIVKKVQHVFTRSGFGALAISALLPPPVPMVPFVMAAGATKYPLKKFLFAITVGRSVRYSLLGFFAARYGGMILGWIAKLGHPFPVIIMTLVFVSGGTVLLIVWRRHRHQATPG